MDVANEHGPDSPVAAQTDVPAPPPNRQESRSVAISPPERLLFKISRSRGATTDEGRGELIWRHDGVNYEAVLRSELPDATATARSSGLLDANGLRPHPPWNGRGSFRAGSTAAVAAMLEEGQRLVPVLMQLRAVAAAASSPLAPGDEMRIEAYAHSTAGAVTFVVEGWEIILFGGRPIEAVKLTSGSASGPRSEIWLARGLGHPLLRFRIAVGSDSLDYVVATQDP